MQQRRLRLGDILDDYCPRERRITNHVVVAMVEDTVKQTRCTTCDADHEYKEARVPSSRRKKPADLIPSDAALRPASAGRTSDDLPIEDPLDDPAATEEVLAGPDASHDPDEEPADGPEGPEEDWPVHRRLIRATLPRPEGQTPERKAPDFTLRQSGGRFEGNRNGARGRGRPRHGQGGSGGGQHARSGSRPGGPASSGQHQGNRSGNVAGHRGGRPQGQGRGNRQGQPGGGQGRKRGR